MKNLWPLKVRWSVFFWASGLPLAKSGTGVCDQNCLHLLFVECCMHHDNWSFQFLYILLLKCCLQTKINICGVLTEVLQWEKVRRVQNCQVRSQWTCYGLMFMCDDISRFTNWKYNCWVHVRSLAFVNGITRIWRQVGGKMGGWKACLHGGLRNIDLYHGLCLKELDFYLAFFSQIW